MRAAETILETTPFIPTVLETDLPWPVRRGKVRDVYDVTDRVGRPALLLVATDRISAYDVVMPTGIPGKGALLTAMSRWWFGFFGDVPNHLLGDPGAYGLPDVGGRATLVRKLQVVPFECVVRGYLEGSGWSQYEERGEVCGVKLPAGLRKAGKLPEPVFTPTTKAASGHDEPATFAQLSDAVGGALARTLRDRTVQLYERAASHAASRGILLADAKLEWGVDEDGRVVLADEVFTPDSSRFWPADGYAPGREQASFDKQFVRDYLATLDWDRRPPGPALPADVVAGTRARYAQAFERLTGGEAGGYAGGMRIAAWALAGLSAGVLCVGGCRTAAPPGPPPRATPYNDFFEAAGPEGIFLLADLPGLQRYDLDPRSVPFERFVTQAGRPVFIDARDPELVERIRVGFEDRAELTVLPLDPRGGEAEGEPVPDPPESRGPTSNQP